MAYESKFNVIVLGVAWQLQAYQKNTWPNTGFWLGIILRWNISSFAITNEKSLIS